MPFPLIPVIAAGAQVLGAGINAASTSSNNKKNRAHEIAMYERQKADNLAQWHLQNDYNSPAAQMARLKQGGLNPHLVYGNGTSTLASPVPQTSMTVGQNTAPQWGNMTDGINSYIDVQAKTAQTDNLKAQQNVLIQEAALKAGQVAGQTLSNKKSGLDYDIALELKQNSLEAAAEALRKMQIDNTFQLDENDRRNVSNTQSIKESAERILSSRAARATSEVERKRIIASIEGIKNSNELQTLDLQLKRAGIQPSDPLYMRILGRAVGGGMGDVLKSIDDWTRQKSKSFQEYFKDLF